MNFLSRSENWFLMLQTEINLKIYYGLSINFRSIMTIIDVNSPLDDPIV